MRTGWFYIHFFIDGLMIIFTYRLISVKENLIVSDANDTDDNNKTEEENDEDYDEQEIQLEESVDEGKKKTTAIEISYTPAREYNLIN